MQMSQWDAAIAESQLAIRLDPTHATAHANLGEALRFQGRIDEAILECREAVRLNAGMFQAQVNLGTALHDKGLIDGAIRAYREATRLKKDSAWAHSCLGNALMEKGLVDAAIVEGRQAVTLKKDLPEAHNNLGWALMEKGRPQEGIDEYREAIRLRQDYPKAHYNLGNALRDCGRTEEALASFRDAIRFDTAYAEAHCNLGLLLLASGRFADAVRAIRRGHELGMRKPAWPYPSARWLLNAEHFADLEARLPTFLHGTAKPADAAESLMLAQLCATSRRLYAAAAGFYVEAFSAQTKLADDLSAQNRYNAACVAALAGCGEGSDQPPQDEVQRRAWRKRALHWLRADLAAYTGLLDAGHTPRATVGERLEHWQQDHDLSAVRDGAALAKLPATEGDAWRKLWGDVEALLARVQNTQTTGGPGCRRRSRAGGR
jgi:tetratricopeptide (TPR) repeat protein